MPLDANGAFLSFRNVKKSYDQKTLVVKDFNLDVQKGEFITLLGPSGSGKSTVLMMLAGFEGVTSGDIVIAGQSVTRTAPYRRNIGMVFQNYALFPHMTIAENLAYPLRVRKMNKAAVKDRVNEYLRLIEMGSFGGRYPGQLSGGQRQRVALARALIFEPSLILMDEPLGALDKKLREQMQYEITRLHEQLGFTVIYVTHDQTEALTMSSRIAVFNDGVVQQCAAPAQLYERPSNAFVADFIGENNFIPGKVDRIEGGKARVTVAGGGTITADAAEGLKAGADCVLSIRPEKLFIKPTSHAYDNELVAEHVTHHYVGDFIRFYFRVAEGTEITIKVLNDLAAPDLKAGDKASLVWLAKDCIAFPA
ncbi:ABC transporter ATP-binding protein [Defluviimonas salinarum]|uniref:Spermidine/putrescine import ATP-binding protein PotA n=1 Tax=Defluviimonas salinarum TaxID=2992147 RepID=A0ABT3J3U2_9RHOB|nr:ABC transporter ATP-binding protein [Defluviimonas salinarum]MCW3782362.1 ABC transporter ATP-binding protein [Defluviimonas salinarum]